MDSVTKSEAEKALYSVLTQADTEEFVADEDLCKSLMKCMVTHPELREKVAEVFAALAVEENFRDIAKDHDVLVSLVPFLNFSVFDVRLQVLRAVGNLCIDHDHNREAVLSSGGCKLLFEQLSRCLDDSSEDGQSDRIKCITCGCILNLANDNEKLSKELLGLNVVDGLINIVSIPHQSQNTISMALRALAVLLDYAEIESLLNSPFSIALPAILRLSREWNEDLVETTLGMIGVLAGNDKWKLHLVKSGSIAQLLEVNVSSAIRRVMDIVILIIAEDECLDLLCKENTVISKAMEWISSDEFSLEAKASAALVVANMARNEGNCVLLVERGIVPLLVALTKLEEPKELFGKLHHSALSALRNLSIPSQNKPLFLELGVVDAGLSLLKQSTQSHVQFKAMGMLRLLAEKQDATCSRIILEGGLIDRVCQLCGMVGPVHIQSEGSRLLAVLVKYCKSPELMIQLATEEGIKWIYSLLKSESIVMMNDGLLALNLLAALKNDAIFDVMKKADLSQKISSIITSHITSVEIVCNALSLIVKLSASDEIKSLLADSKELIQSIQQLPSFDLSHEMKSLLDDVSQVLNIEPQ